MRLNIRAFLRETFQITNEEILRQAEDSGRLEHMKKGELLIEAGEQHQTISILLCGVARGFLFDANGHEISDCFSSSCGDVLMGSNDMHSASTINIEAVTECDVLQFPAVLILEWLDRYPEIVRIYNQFLIQGLSRHWKAKICMCSYPAMQRYQWFLENYPGLEHVVNSKDIASFLGITPVTLSRLRRQLGMLSAAAEKRHTDLGAQQMLQEDSCEQG